jgi:2'-5' RNA ligase
MKDTERNEAADIGSLEELQRFRSISRLRNHWSRPVGPRSYYWYLTFEDSAALHSLARKCQDAIAFPYYDLTPLRSLHLSLDRIAFEGDISQDQLDAIEGASICACMEVAPFDVSIGSLGGTRGAIGFTVSPVQPIQELRDKFRAATLAAYPDAPISRSEFRPHVTIAYANSDGVPAAQAVAAVEKVRSARRADVTIKNVVLVLLERRERSYTWQEISHIPLVG